MNNFALFKSAAGRKLGRYARKRVWVTPKGGSKKVPRTPFLEIQDMDAGIRYSLRVIPGMTKEAARLRRLFENNVLDAIKLEVRTVKDSDGTAYQALGVDSTKVGKFIPIFKIGSVIGVVNKFRDEVLGMIESKRTAHTLDSAIAAYANKIGMTVPQFLGKEESPLAEYEEAGFGAQFHKFTGPVGQAYENRLAKLTNK